LVWSLESEETEVLEKAPDWMEAEKTGHVNVDHSDFEATPILDQRPVDAPDDDLPFEFPENWR